jgi:hypothetical protein
MKEKTEAGLVRSKENGIEIKFYKFKYMVSLPSEVRTQKQ